MPRFRLLSSALPTVVLMALGATAQAQSVVFSDNLGSCASSASSVLVVDTATRYGPAPHTPIKVNLFRQVGAVQCTGWTFTGASYMVTKATGSLGAFPSMNGVEAPKAIWMNESTPGIARGTMARTVSGLAVGRRYTLTADAWTDDYDDDTALGLDFGPVTTSMDMVRGSGPQRISASLCALTPSLTLTLYENNGTGASPVVTNVELIEEALPCEFVVKFDSQGGSAVPDQTVVYDDPAAQPTPPARAGQVFDGWYTDTSFSTRYDFATPVQANITLYAKWVTGPSYTVSGSIVGLAAGNTVGLANTGNGDTLPTASGSSFAFPTGTANAAPYEVTVTTQPAGQTCSVAQNGSGSITNANVTNVVVTCITHTYPLAGTVVGLAPGQTVELANGGEQLPVNGASFAFATPLPHGSSYAVSVAVQPAGQTCTVTQGNGTATAPVNNVLVTCSANAYPLSGTVVGLAPGQTVVLANGGEQLPVSGASFAFATPLAHGSSYAVSVLTQPAGQTCTATQNTGTMTAPVNSVLVSCVNSTQPPEPTPVPAGTPAGLLLLGAALAGLGWRSRKRA